MFKKLMVDFLNDYKDEIKTDYFLSIHGKIFLLHCIDKSIKSNKLTDLWRTTKLVHKAI